MSLKAIEMQVSIPRSQSVGKLQDQLQQRAQVTQGHLGIEQNKEDEKKRKQVLEMTESEKKRLNNDDESNKNSSSEKNKQHPSKIIEENKEAITAKHPYKGNFVDFSG